MELSEELLEIKNTEIRVLIEKLHEKDEFIRDMTIQYADYFADYEARYGNSIHNYDRILNELYYTKEHYIDLLKNAYNDSDRKDKEKEILIKQQEEELSVLKKEIDRLKPYEEMVSDIVRKANAQKTPEDKPSLKDYIYNDNELEQIDTLLRQHISSQLGKQRQALPIRAAHDAGKIKLIPYKVFRDIFQEATVSETVYNNITSETHEILPTLLSEYQQLKSQFESLST
jgi:hypothetical protein